MSLSFLSIMNQEITELEAQIEKVRIEYQALRTEIWQGVYASRYSDEGLRFKQKELEIIGDEHLRLCNLLKQKIADTKLV